MTIARPSVAALCAIIVFAQVVMADMDSPWIGLNGSAEVRVNDADSLDGIPAATWNIWLKQDSYTDKAGIIGKYKAVNQGRAYLIRTALTNGLSVVLSGDGRTIGTFSSSTGRRCGVRNDGEWTMVTVTYNGSTIRYYRNGALCDTDQTLITSLYNSTSPLRLGGGNSLFFKGGVDEVTMYNTALAREQVGRFYNESVHGQGLGPSIPVLVYHEISPVVDSSFVVTPDQFAQQMAYLHDHAFNPITVQQYAEWRQGQGELPKNPIIIMFDDGFKTVYTAAKPVMDAYGFKGSVAIVTNYASSTSPTSRYMNWTLENDLFAQGWSSESHGLSHSHMLTLNESAFRAQLEGSRALITRNVNVSPSSFVFPFHEANQTYTSICGEYYPLCWTQGSLYPTYNFKATNGTEYMGLRRINMWNSTTIADMESFLGKESGKVGEWPMDEHEGETTHDHSGNANTGFLLNGASWYTNATCPLSTGDTASFSEVDVRLLQDIIMRTMVPERYRAGSLGLHWYTSQAISSESLPYDIRMFDELGFAPKHPRKEIRDMYDNVIDSDEGRPPLPLPKEKRWPDNMNHEADYDYEANDPDRKDKKAKKKK